MRESVRIQDTSVIRAVAVEEDTVATDGGPFEFGIVDGSGVGAQTLRNNYRMELILISRITQRDRPTEQLTLTEGILPSVLGGSPVDTNSILYDYGIMEGDTPQARRQRNNNRELLRPLSLRRRISKFRSELLVEEKEIQLDLPGAVLPDFSTTDRDGLEWSVYGEKISRNNMKETLIVSQIRTARRTHNRLREVIAVDTLLQQPRSIALPTTDVPAPAGRNLEYGIPEGLDQVSTICRNNYRLQLVPTSLRQQRWVDTAADPIYQQQEFRPLAAAIDTEIVSAQNRQIERGLAPGIDPLSKLIRNQDRESLGGLSPLSRSRFLSTDDQGYEPRPRAIFEPEAFDREQSFYTSEILLSNLSGRTDRIQLDHLTSLEQVEDFGRLASRLLVYEGNAYQLQIPLSDRLLEDPRSFYTVVIGNLFYLGVSPQISFSSEGAILFLTLWRVSALSGIALISQDALLPYYETQQRSILGGTNPGNYVTLRDTSRGTGLATEQIGEQWARAVFASEVQIQFVIVGGGSLPGVPEVSRFLNGAQIFYWDGNSWEFGVEIFGITDSGINQLQRYDLPVFTSQLEIRRIGGLALTEFRIGIGTSTVVDILETNPNPPQPIVGNFTLSAAVIIFQAGTDTGDTINITITLDRDPGDGLVEITATPQGEESSLNSPFIFQPGQSLTQTVTVERRRNQLDSTVNELILFEIGSGTTSSFFQLAQPQTLTVILEQIAAILTLIPVSLTFDDTTGTGDTLTFEVSVDIAPSTFVELAISSDLSVTVPPTIQISDTDPVEITVTRDTDASDSAVITVQKSAGSPEYPNFEPKTVSVTLEETASSPLLNDLMFSYSAIDPSGYTANGENEVTEFRSPSGARVLTPFDSRFLTRVFPLGGPDSPAQGIPYLYLSSADRQYNLDQNVVLNESYTIALAAEITTVNRKVTIIAINTPPGVPSQVGVARNSGIPILFYYRDGGGFPIPLGWKIVVIEVRVSAGTDGNDLVTLYVDGGLVGTLNSRFNVPEGEARACFVGGYPTTEFRLYNRALTLSERQEVEGELAVNAGLLSNLPLDHPARNP